MGLMDAWHDGCACTGDLDGQQAGRAGWRACSRDGRSAGRGFLSGGKIAEELLEIFVRRASASALRLCPSPAATSSSPTWRWRRAHAPSPCVLAKRSAYGMPVQPPFGRSPPWAHQQ
jgi:hypothetical protein